MVTGWQVEDHRAEVGDRGVEVADHLGDPLLRHVVRDLIADGAHGEARAEEARGDLVVQPAGDAPALLEQGALPREQLGCSRALGAGSQGDVSCCDDGVAVIGHDHQAEERLDREPGAVVSMAPER